MKLVIGTDEAGYGPNLGPLVVTGTAWLISEQDQANWAGESDDLFDVFGEFFARCTEESGGRLSVGDSKQVFPSGGGLSDLEQLVLCLVKPVCSWNELLDKLTPGRDTSDANNLPWYDGFDPRLPLDSEMVSDAVKVETVSGSKPILQRAAVVEPRAFNSGCDRFGNKATLLSQTTLSIVDDLMRRVMESKLDEGIECISVICDKHGGRSKYAALLQEMFIESWVRVDKEGRDCSRYLFEFNQIPVEIEFLARGESKLPIAAASMISKYLREVCMRAFNEFWQKKIPNLAPTAGYPVDAKRFRAVIEEKVPELGLSNSDWWRER